MRVCPSRAGPAGARGAILTPEGSGISTGKEIEQDFRDSLERLLLGKPTNEVNTELLRRGRLKITKASVAREAGHSRTTYVNHPDIAQYVAQAIDKKHPVLARAEHDLIRGLREENVLLRLEKAKLATRVANLVNHVARLEKQVERQSRHSVRRGERRTSTPLSVVGSHDH